MSDLTSEWYWDGHNVLWRAENKAYYCRAKRLLDLLLTIPTVIFLSPFLFVIAILIKWDSPGPALFVQERVGCRQQIKDGVVVWQVCNFRFLKFRSMYHNSDQSLHRAHIEAFVKGDLQPDDDSQAAYKLADDPRVTRVGNFLRKTSLDELPQLFNVLKGEMSLVGPRPVPTYEAERYEKMHFERLTALPGITGLWQVKGRGRVTFEEMIEMDIEYVRRRSLVLDLKLLLLTLPAVLFGKGAR